MDKTDIDENPLLADRIQLSISINFIIVNIRWEELTNKKIVVHYLKDKVVNEEGFTALTFYQNIFSEYLKDKKRFGVRYDGGKKQYNIEVPEECYNGKFPFCSHVRLRLDNPYTATTEFNFNRLLRKYAKETDNFNDDYDKSIRVADDNYINKRVWEKWDSYLVKGLAESIPDIAFKLADYIIKQYITDFERSYEVVTVKQVEFNKDYFVGHHKSADVLHQLMYFIISSSGVEWINKLSGYAISVYKAEESNNKETRFYGDHYNPTLAFPIAKGVSFKIYRKTTDDIRFEKKDSLKENLEKKVMIMFMIN